MKARGALIQGGLAAAGLVAAYVTWQRPPEDIKGDVTMLDVGRNSLEKVRYDDGLRWVELRPQGKSEEAVVWLEQGSRPPPAAPTLPGAGADGGVALAGGADAGTNVLASLPPPPAPPPPREVRGNERAQKLLEKFAPMRASRLLGTLSDAKAKELGFVDSKRKLEVFAGGVSYAYTVASPTAGGFVSSYVRDDKSGNVYLVAGSLLSELDPSSQQLVERRLHAFKPTDFNGFLVNVEGKAREFVQTGAETPATTKVAPKAAPDKPDEMVRNWHDRLFNRLIVTEVLGKTEKPASGEPKVVLRVEYTGRGGTKGWLEVARGAGAAPAAPAAPGAPPAGEYFGRSEQTAGWVRLGGPVEELLTEAKKVVAASS